jgi:hypothetical protein
MSNEMRHDLLYGAQAIADYLGLPLRRTRYLIHTKSIPTTRLTERIICANKYALDRVLGREQPQHIRASNGESR